VGPLTDGLLVLRHGFGFSGGTIVTGAVGSGCGRCTGPEVTAYLNSIAGQLDIDDNGAFGALTDGLLVLRHLFGFTGATLVNGAVAANCNRCDAGEIDAYLDGLEN
jgi:hypothetical protein